MSEKLQKLLARAGLGSRRMMEEWIAQGRVRINRQVAQLGARAEPTDRIFVDNKPITIKPTVEQPRVWLYHKPTGEVCTRFDPSGRPTVFDHLSFLRKGQWVLVGRLDINTSGLLLLTDSGELANRLMHPRYQVEREYAVRIFGEVEPIVLKRLRAGVKLTDGIAKFDSIIEAGGEGRNHWYHVVLREGRNREVRRLWESQGLQVSRLIRVRYGSIVLPRNLPAGKAIRLTGQQTSDVLHFSRHLSRIKQWNN